MNFALPEANVHGSFINPMALGLPKTGSEDQNAYLNSRAAAITARTLIRWVTHAVFSTDSYPVDPEGGVVLLSPGDSYIWVRDSIPDQSNGWTAAF